MLLLNVLLDLTDELLLMFLLNVLLDLTDELLLMFLLNVLLDLTDELDLFCRLFAMPNTSASLYSLITYQIKFPPPNPGY